MGISEHRHSLPVPQAGIKNLRYLQRARADPVESPNPKTQNPKKLQIPSTNIVAGGLTCAGKSGAEATALQELARIVGCTELWNVCRGGALTVKGAVLTMMSRYMKLVLTIGLLVFAGALLSSCASGPWSPELPEKGSAKGGAAWLMKR
jgi:hypothetical protein